jgi:hypothetical protein
MCSAPFRVTNGCADNMRGTSEVPRLDVMSVPRARAVTGPRKAVPTEFVKNALTISEPANQAVRPAYAKLDEGCSKWAEPSFNA